MAKPLAEIRSLRPTLVHRAHLRVLLAAVELAQSVLHQPWALEKARLFFGSRPQSREDLERTLDDLDAHAHFLPWLLWDAERDDGTPLGATLRRRWHSGAEREVVEALLATRPDVFEVTATGDKSTVLRRLTDGAAFAVDEPVLQQIASEGEVYVARVLRILPARRGQRVAGAIAARRGSSASGVELLDAVHGCMPAAARGILQRAARKAADGPRDQVLLALLAACERAGLKLARGCTALTEAKGQVRATLVFDLRDPAGAATRLQDLAGSGDVDVRLGTRHGIVAPHLGPVGAVLRVHEGRLYASTSTPWRRHELQAAVAKIAPGARLRCTLYRDLAPLFDPQRREECSRQELRSLAEDWLGECVLTFPDTPHVWLGGATPREAVRTPDGRSQVQAWLRAVEVLSDVAGPACRDAVANLRRELGEA
jgi:hypothetical protein